MIYLSGRLEPRDYLQALYLHHRPPKLVGLSVPIVIGGYAGAVLFYGAKHFSAMEITVLMFPLFVIILWCWVVLPEQTRAQFYGDPTLSDQYEFTITFDQILISSTFQSGAFRWAQFSHYKMNSVLILLYRSESEFYVFPYRWFSSLGDAQFFQDCLRQIFGRPEW